MEFMDEQTVHMLCKVHDCNGEGLQFQLKIWGMFLSDISHTGGFLIFESLKKKNLKGAGALNRMNMVCKKTMKKVF